MLSAETEQKTLPAAPPTKLDKPSWERVLSGMTVAQPKKTSYGFLQMLDGRILVACASDGKVLWQQPLNGKPGSFITVDSINDFCYALVNENKKLQLYNPSGIWLWTATLPEPAIFEPLPGRDGRIFVQGAEHILCYGINGKLKWSTQVSRTGGFPLYELPDGSLLYIQEKKLRGKSTALRISPYGSILEELTFSGVVSSAGQTKQGVILVFSDGAVGCCSVKDGMAYSQWIRSGVITKPDSCTVLETASVCTLIAASSGGSQAVLFPQFCHHGGHTAACGVYGGVQHRQPADPPDGGRNHRYLPGERRFHPAKRCADGGAAAVAFCLCQQWRIPRHGGAGPCGGRYRPVLYRQPAAGPRLPDRRHPLADHPERDVLHEGRRQRLRGRSGRSAHRAGAGF